MRVYFINPRIVIGFRYEGLIVEENGCSTVFFNAQMWSVSHRALKMLDVHMLKD